eukprot:jgi/Mesvir1/18108/Mv09406-RA.1
MRVLDRPAICFAAPPAGLASCSAPLQPARHGRPPIVHKSLNALFRTGGLDTGKLATSRCLSPTRGPGPLRRHSGPVCMVQSSGGASMGSGNLGFPNGADAPAGSGSPALWSRLEVPLLLSLWYINNICYNVLTKNVLLNIPLPFSMSAFHLLVSSCLCLAGWYSGLLRRKHTMTGDELVHTLPLAASNMVGHLLGQISVCAVAVSFTHTIKASEPFFYILISKFLVPGFSVSLPILATLVPMVGGVALACLGELSFNWTGFLGAILSNVAYAFRAVVSKRSMVAHGANTAAVSLDRLNAVDTYSYMTLLAAPCLLLTAALVDRSAFLPAVTATVAKHGGAWLVATALLAGCTYHLDNLLSFVLLEKVNTVTHGVGRVGQRLFTIFASILVFGNPTSARGIFGILVAVSSVGLYSYLVSHEPDAVHED